MKIFCVYSFLSCTQKSPLFLAVDQTGILTKGTLKKELRQFYNWDQKTTAEAHFWQIMTYFIFDNSFHHSFVICKMEQIDWIMTFKVSPNTKMVCVRLRF